MRRFLLALKGRRAPVQDDDADTYRPWWWGADEDPSLKVIRAEARQRAHDDLMEAIAKGEARPQKRLGVITTGDIGRAKKEGQK